MNESELAGGIDRRQGTDSARETWFSIPTAPKSLILVKSAAMTDTAFATSYRVFATSPFLDNRRAPPSFSLFKLLKEKKKEGCEAKEFRDTGAPRVDLDLPSVRGAAYFLGHQFHVLCRPNSWHLMASVFFEISDLPMIHRPATCPRVALRVVRLRTHSEAGR
ncbi:hypothetical protein ABH944_002474 [Caballeronia udeis]|uniref:Uncharacterized protein n=1 Tax=Caballeronia udeis TaxID=1232866 RepID=A0ABW8MEC3_9BURK